MQYIYSVLLGAVQGITEFAPVSSSGHLLALREMFRVDLSQSLAFDLALHLGTFFAVAIYFRVEILKYLAAVIEIFIPGRQADRVDLNAIRALIYATLPAAALGFIFGEAIENVFRNVWTVIISLAAGAILFFLVERMATHDREFTGLSIGRALYIGVAQVLAFIPGVSRSGITIIAGMSVKLKREEAARFSFLLSLPTIAGAAVFKLVEINWQTLPLFELWMFILGFTASLTAGFFVIKYFLRFVQHNKLNVFGWYRLGVAFVLLIWLLIKM